MNIVEKEIYNLHNKMDRGTVRRNGNLTITNKESLGLTMEWKEWWIIERWDKNTRSVWNWAKKKRNIWAVKWTHIVTNQKKLILIYSYLILPCLVKTRFALNRPSLESFWLLSTLSTKVMTCVLDTWNMCSTISWSTSFTKLPRRLKISKKVTWTNFLKMH